MSLPLEQQARVRSYEVQLIGFTREGEAIGQVIARLPDASTPAVEADESLPQTLHVPVGIPGERVIVSVEEPLPRRGRRRGRRHRPLPPRVTLVQVLERSPWRVEAPCPHFGVCGGCQLQHIDYARQLEIKREMVADLLRSEGGFAEPPVLPTLPCEPPWRYRNQMRFSVNREGQIGLTARASRRLIPLTDCPIAHPSINAALRVLAETPQPRPQVQARCGANTGQVLLQPMPTPEVRAQLEAAGFEVRERIWRRNWPERVF